MRHSLIQADLKVRLYACLAGVLLAAAACSRADSPESAAPVTTAPVTERKYLLETRRTMRRWCSCTRTGSRSLPLREKTLIWHLYQAAIAGRDIYLRPEAPRRARDAWRARSDREPVPQGIDPATLSAIQQLHEAVLDQQRPYNNLTARKFVLTVDAPGVRGRREEGGPVRRDLPDAPGESLDALLARLQPMFFDPDRRSDRHQQDATRRARTS